MFLYDHTNHEQSLADAGSETRPPMIKRGSYVPCSSRFMRYIERKRDTKKFLKHSIEEGPYQMKQIPATDTAIARPQTKDDLTGDDACENERDTWDNVKRLMQGTELSKIERESRFLNEFDKFKSEAEESFSFLYNRFSQLINDLERNKIKPITMSVNTKFLNSLQPEWNKYVTNVHLTKKLVHVTYDALFDHLQQYEGIVNAFRAKWVAKTHDPLALVANTYASSSYS
ncbi:hypothetical protein Tco_0589111 [Tanacetum coccineum]